MFHIRTNGLVLNHSRNPLLYNIRKSNHIRDFGAASLSKPNECSEEVLASFADAVRERFPKGVEKGDVVEGLIIVFLARARSDSCKYIGHEVTVPGPGGTKEVEG